MPLMTMLPQPREHSSIQPAETSAFTPVVRSSVAVGENTHPTNLPGVPTKSAEKSCTLCQHSALDDSFKRVPLVVYGKRLNATRLLMIVMPKDPKTAIDLASSAVQQRSPTFPLMVFHCDKSRVNSMNYELWAL